MQAIRTVYRGPTDTRGSRIVATSYLGRTVFPYDYELSLDNNHARAAEIHVAKAFTAARLISAALSDGSHAHIITRGE